MNILVVLLLGLVSACFSQGMEWGLPELVQNHHRAVAVCSLSGTPCSAAAPYFLEVKSNELFPLQLS